jgi:hypothetical protein
MLDRQQHENLAPWSISRFPNLQELILAHVVGTSSFSSHICVELMKVMRPLTAAAWRHDARLSVQTCMLYTAGEHFVAFGTVVNTTGILAEGSEFQCLFALITPANAVTLPEVSSSPWLISRWVHPSLATIASTEIVMCFLAVLFYLRHDCGKLLTAPGRYMSRTIIPHIRNDFHGAGSKL